MPDRTQSSTDNSKTTTFTWGKTVLFFVVVTLILGGILSLIAGRPDWWEAWILSSLYTFFVLGVVVWGAQNDPDLIEERRHQAENVKSWDKVIMGIHTPTLLLMLVVCGLDAGRFGWSSMPLVMKIAALVGFIPAVVLFWGSLRANTYLSSYARIQDDRDHQVVTTGPYQHIRHPMYVGVILFALCTPLFLGSWWAMIPAGVDVILFILRTALEDKMLLAELEGYKDYAREVRYRLLPGVW
jgi:protein-S-isoprenylcysteine O-methyltransferase Ste14